MIHLYPLEGHPVAEAVFVGLVYLVFCTVFGQAIGRFWSWRERVQRRKADELKLRTGAMSVNELRYQAPSVICHGAEFPIKNFSLGGRSVVNKEGLITHFEPTYVSLDRPRCDSTLIRTMDERGP